MHFYTTLVRHINFLRVSSRNKDSTQERDFQCPINTKEAHYPCV